MESISRIVVIIIMMIFMGCVIVLMGGGMVDDGCPREMRVGKNSPFLARDPLLTAPPPSISLVSLVCVADTGWPKAVGD
jgi:hypothetical protein